MADQAAALLEAQTQARQQAAMNDLAPYAPVALKKGEYIAEQLLVKDKSPARNEKRTPSQYVQRETVSSCNG